MKKFDKEYFTQYTPEKIYLQNNGIYPSFVKVINGVTTYKYTKSSRLFELLAIFYIDNKRGDNKCKKQNIQKNCYEQCVKKTT